MGDRALQMLSGWDAPRVLALLNKLGGPEKAEALLSGKLDVRWLDANRPLFDRNGRRIPEGLAGNVCDPNSCYVLKDRPFLGNEQIYARRLEQLRKAFNGINGTDVGEITALDFKVETERLLELIQNNPKFSNLLKGIYFPVVFPKNDSNYIGVTLYRYIMAARQGYLAEFPMHEFSFLDFDLCPKDEIIRVGCLEISHHSRIFSRTKDKSVVGIYFPAALQGFSINASREQMETLPNELILSGLDVLAALAMYPDILGHALRQQPVLDMNAFIHLNNNRPLRVQVDNDRVRVYFAKFDQLANASGTCSPGLLYIGK